MRTLLRNVRHYELLLAAAFLVAVPAEFVAVSAIAGTGGSEHGVATDHPVLSDCEKEARGERAG